MAAQDAKAAAGAQAAGDARAADGTAHEQPAAGGAAAAKQGTGTKTGAKPAATKPAAATCAKRKPKKGGIAWKRQRTRRIHRGVRWAVQIAFFVLAPTLFSAGFNGVKSIFFAIGSTDAVEFASFVMLLAALLAFTIVFGRFFCGHACAFGTLNDVVYTVFTPLRRALHIPDKVLPDGVQRALQLLKYVVLVAICILCFGGWWEYVSGYSPWTTFGVLLELKTTGIGTIAIVVFALLIVGMVFVERFFCQFFCPFGALFSLMPILPCSSYRREPQRCAKRCGMCKASCPVNIYPDADEFAAGECISCGRCCDGCPTSNIAMLRIGWHHTDEQGAGRRAQAGGFIAHLKAGVLRIKGDEVPYTIFKALVLLAICWVLGVLNYVPSFSSLFG